MKKQIQCKKDVMALAEEKDEMKRKYTNLMCNVKKWTVDTPKSVMDTMFWRCTDYPSFDIFNVPAKMCVCVCVNTDIGASYRIIWIRGNLIYISGEKYRIMSEQKKSNKNMGDLKEENEKFGIQDC
jgi:hypothetical protein